VVLEFLNIKSQKEGKEFFDKGVKVFNSKNCWSKYLARNLFPAKPAKQFLILPENQPTARLKILQQTVKKTC